MNKEFQRKMAGVISEARIDEAKLDPFKSLGEVQGVSDIYRHSANMYSFEYKGKKHFMFLLNGDELYITKQLDFVNFDDEWDGAGQTKDYVKQVLDGKIP